MRTVTKKLILCVLTLSMLISCVALAGCKKKGQQQTQEENTLGDILDSVEKNDDSALTLPSDLNYAGESFTVLTYNALVDEFGNSTGENKDVVEEALFTRDSFVEEKLDVEFVYNKLNGQFKDRENFFATVSNSILMEFQAWDLIGCYSMIAPHLALEGALYDMQTLEYMDFSRAWYPQFMLDASTINGKTYFMTGDISTNTLYSMYGVAFNTSQANARGLKESKLYQMVYNNEWTYEALFEMCQELGVAGSDGVWDENDFYPIVTTSDACIDVFYFSSGLTLINEDAEGHLSISDDVTGEKTQLIYSLVYDAKNTYKSYYAYSDNVNVIMDNRCIFSISPIINFKTSWADSDEQFRILPLPKFEEGDSTKYQTLLSMPHTQYCIPRDSENLERSTAVMEYLGYASYNYVTPEIFEQTMKLRYSANEDCSKMFDIMREGCTFDIGSLFYMSFTPGVYRDAHSMFRNAVKGNITNWQSYYLSYYESALVAVTEKLNQFYGG